MNLENLGVQEMSAQEAMKIEGGGGFWGPVAGGLIIATFVAVIADWDNFKKGLKGEPEIKN